MPVLYDKDGAPVLILGTGDLAVDTPTPTTIRFTQPHAPGKMGEWRPLKLSEYTTLFSLTFVKPDNIDWYIRALQGIKAHLTGTPPPPETPCEHNWVQFNAGGQVVYGCTKCGKTK